MNPDTLKKAYEEIDNLGRSPSMSDVERLPYITAIVMETHRIRPPVNFLSHAPLQDDTVDGLSIKQGSWVIGNIWYAVIVS
jgi:cytochrome P450